MGLDLGLMTFIMIYFVIHATINVLQSVNILQINKCYQMNLVLKYLRKIKISIEYRIGTKLMMFIYHRYHNQLSIILNNQQQCRLNWFYLNSKRIKSFIY